MPRSGSGCSLYGLFVCVVALVTARQSEVCPSVCLCEPGAPPVCPHQLIEGLDTGREKFAEGLKEFDDNGQAVRMLADDSLSRWNGSSLMYVDMSSLNIVNISGGALMSLVNVWYLNLSANKISTVHTDTFRYNSALWWLALSFNNITDISHSTFQNQTKLGHLDMSNNRITYLKPDTFNQNRNLLWLSLANNMIADIHPSTFQQQYRLDHLDISGNRLRSIKPDTFNCNKRLTWLSLARNDINDINNQTLQNLRALHNLDLSDNQVTKIYPDTFQYNWFIHWLSVANNRITDIDQRTFRNQTKLVHLDMAKNKISSIKPGTLYDNVYLTWLSLAQNNITTIHPLAFANQSRLQHLDLSGNGISGVNSSTFSMQQQLQTLILSDNKLRQIDPKHFSARGNLQNLFLAGNNISDVDSKIFQELAQLHQLDLSRNNIKELELLVSSSDRPEHQYRVSTPKYVNLSRNSIQSFHLLQYDPSNNQNDPSGLRFDLEFLDLSSNNLDSLNATTVKWLKQPNVNVNLTGNPWKCECSALGEAWWELRHKLTLYCASPEDRRGRTWDVIEGELCPKSTSTKFSSTDNRNLNTPGINRSTTTESEGVEEFNVSDNQTTNSLFIKDRNGTSTLMIIILIVIGVLSVCVLIAGGIVLVVLIKKLRESSSSSHRSNIYASVPSYQRVSTVPLKDLSSKRECATENIYDTLTRT